MLHLCIAFDIIDLKMINLLLTFISIFLCLTFLHFNLLENDLINALLKVKDIVMNEV